MMTFPRIPRTSVMRPPNIRLYPWPNLRVFRLIELAEVELLDGFVNSITEVQDLMHIDLCVTVDAVDVVPIGLTFVMRVFDAFTHHLIALPL